MNIKKLHCFITNVLLVGKHRYRVGNIPQDNVSEDKYLGITVTESFKSSTQGNIAAA